MRSEELLTRGSQMRTASFRAMDTNVDLGVVEPGDAASVAALDAVEALFLHYDRTLTRFSSESELAALNRSAGAPFQASPLLFEAVAAALSAAEASNGIFDPTVLDALVAAGYDKTFGIVALIEPRSPPGPASPLDGAFREIRLDPATRTITLPQGLHLDLGGIGKGMAVDAAAALLQPFGSFYVDAGGDLRTSGQAEDGPWRVGVQNPFDPGRDLRVIEVGSVGIATSSSVRRRWRRGGVERHHLIDPRTGTSADSDLAAVTVVAEQATTADVLAKVALILGRERGRACVESHGAACLLVCADGRIDVSEAFPEPVHVT